MHTDLELDVVVEFNAKSSSVQRLDDSLSRSIVFADATDLFLSIVSAVKSAFVDDFAASTHSGECLDIHLNLSSSFICTAGSVDRLTGLLLGSMSGRSSKVF